MKFEGEENDISEVQQKLLEDILHNNVIHAGTVRVDAVGKKGDNYVADVKRITLTDEDRGTIKIILKLAPTSEVLRSMMNTGVLFRNEIVMYAKTIPELVKVQKLAGLPERDMIRFPKCYGSHAEAPHELLALEDLMEAGYEMRDRLVSLTDHEIRMVLDQLAKFHSASFAARNHDPDAYASLLESLVDLWSIDDKRSEAVKSAFNKMEEQLISLMDTDDERQCIRGILNQVTSLSAEAAAYDMKSRHSVIVHGDCWTNNIMFKREEDNYTECILIDYQISKCASPAFDIMYLIFNCTDDEIRSRHFDEWIDYYHKCVDDYLASYGLISTYVYPRNRLNEDLKRNGKFLFAICLLTLSALTRESEDCLDFSQMAKDDQNGLETSVTPSLSHTTTSRMKYKVQGLIRSFKRYGYL